MRTIDGKPEYRNGLVSDGAWEGNTSWRPCQFRRGSSVILGVPFQLRGFHTILGMFPVIGGVRRKSGHFGSIPQYWGG